MTFETKCRLLIFLTPFILDLFVIEVIKIESKDGCQFRYEQLILYL